MVRRVDTTHVTSYTVRVAVPSGRALKPIALQTVVGSQALGTRAANDVVTAVVAPAAHVQGMGTPKSKLKSFRITRRKTDFNFVLDQTYPTDAAGRFLVTAPSKPYNKDNPWYVSGARSLAVCLPDALSALHAPNALVVVAHCHDGKHTWLRCRAAASPHFWTFSIKSRRCTTSCQ